MSRIVVSIPARREIQQIYLWIRAVAPVAADRWLDGIQSAIKTLSKSAARCVLAPESDTFEFPIRQLMYGSENRGTYRILFTVTENRVCVLHVRHASMDVLGPGEGGIVESGE